MDAFIRKHQPFFLSLLFALLGLAAATYSLWLSPIDLTRSDLAIITRLIEEENQQLAKQRQEEEEKRKKEEINLNSLSDFLRHINDIANATHVIVRELTPVREGEIKFDLKITADYRTFLDFIAKLEAHDVVIHNLSVHPYDMRDMRTRPPIHAIEFTITPRRNAEPLDNARIKAMMAAVSAPKQRNPFQRFAYVEGEKVRQEVDLTWLFKLNGIARIGDARVATIDNKDYRNNDKLEDMIISSIESDRVNLEKQTDHGPDRYILKFRPPAAR